MSRHAANVRPGLRRAARLGATVVLGAAVYVGAMAGPAAAATTHEVKAGDTLSEIAQQAGLTWQELWGANPSISDPDVIHIGQQLTVPSPGEAADQPAQSESASSESESASSEGGAQSAELVAATADSEQSASPGVWERLAQCESSGNWQANTGNGFYGGLQFTPSSWHAVGGEGLPHNASKAEQIARAEQLQDLQGWGAWPACSAELGLR